MRLWDLHFVSQHLPSPDVYMRLRRENLALGCVAVIISILLKECRFGMFHRCSQGHWDLHFVSLTSPMASALDQSGIGLACCSTDNRTNHPKALM